MGDDMNVRTDKQENCVEKTKRGNRNITYPTIIQLKAKIEQIYFWVV
eukprot:gene9055-6353_t